MIKQITEQLELPLEIIYQLQFAAFRAKKAAKKVVMNIPAMVQLCLDFSTPKTTYVEKAKWTAIGVAAAIATCGIIGAIVKLMAY